MIVDIQIQDASGDSGVLATFGVRRGELRSCRLPQTPKPRLGAIVDYELAVRYPDGVCAKARVKGAITAIRDEQGANLASHKAHTGV